MAWAIKNWEKYQHYKHRSPPWVKLHYDIMTSEEWVSLDDSGRVLLIACILVASRNDGKIPSADYMKRVAYLNISPDFEPLVNTGFLIEIQGDCDNNSDNMLARCKHDASTMQAYASALRTNADPEKRREETEKKKEKQEKEKSFVFSENSKNAETGNDGFLPDSYAKFEGQFSENLQPILDDWKSVKTSYGFAPMLDKREKQAAPILARMIDNNEITMEQTKLAMRKFWNGKKNGKRESWGMQGFIDNISDFMQAEKQQKQAQPRAAFIEAVCPECGGSTWTTPGRVKCARLGCGCEYDTG